MISVLAGLALAVLLMGFWLFVAPGLMRRRGVPRPVSDQLDPRTKRVTAIAATAAYLKTRTLVLLEILPVYDSLELALDHHLTTDGNGSPTLTGLQNILRQFDHALTNLDVTPIMAYGRPFDPAVHEAVSVADVSEQPAGHVAQVVQRGFMLGGVLLRPAKVVVSQRLAAADRS